MKKRFRPGVGYGCEDYPGDGVEVLAVCADGARMIAVTRKADFGRYIRDTLEDRWDVWSNVTAWTPLPKKLRRKQ